MSRGYNFHDSLCRTTATDVIQILKKLQLDSLNIVVKDGGCDKRHVYEDQVVSGPYTIIIKASIYPANLGFTTVIFKDGKRLMPRENSIIGKTYLSKSKKLLRVLLKEPLFKARDELVLNNTNNS